jgi:hypothetical protein
MHIKKALLGLTLSMMLGNGAVVAADFDKGMKAYDSQNYEAALAEWLPLAEQGNVKAQRWLGHLYGVGQGVPLSDAIAFKWHLKSAEQGYAPAQKDVAMSYANGDGVAEDDKKAVKWLIKSAKQGYDWSQFFLARMHQDGEGVLTNYVRAYMWYELTLYNSPKSDFAFHAKELKQLTAQKMTKADISSAQEMASRCLKSGYSDC